MTNIDKNTTTKSVQGSSVLPCFWQFRVVQLIQMHRPSRTHLEDYTLWLLLSYVCLFACFTVNKIFSHHISPLHILSYDQVVLSSEHKERVLCKSSNISFLHELQQGSKSFRVSFCYLMSPHLLSDDVAHRGRRQHERKVANNSQV